MSSLRIAGFGACMIGGYPHERDRGLFEVACRLIEKHLSRPVQFKIVSLGGFPAPRAEKHLRPRVFDFNPHYIVLQFGPTDAQCPIRSKSRPTDHTSQPNAILGNAINQNRGNLNMLDGWWETSHDQPYNLLSPFRWEVASTIGFLRKIKPITPLSTYIKAMERMVDDCVSADITPVVLSPFVFGSRYTMRNAILYTNALHQLCSRVRGTVFVDCIRVLTKFRRSRMLMNDGFHLSGAAHSLIGEAIGQSIIAEMRTKILMAA